MPCYVYLYCFHGFGNVDYHVDSPNHVIASTASDSLFVSRAVLKELAEYWPIANVLMKLFDKYANDKMKRAKVIKTGSKIAELQELHADQKNVSSESNMNNYYCSDSGTEIQNDIIAKNDGSPLTYGNRPSPTHLMSSGVSPSSTLNKGNRSQPNIEQLVQQIKHLKEDIKKLICYPHQLKLEKRRQHRQPNHSQIYH